MNCTKHKYTMGYWSNPRYYQFRCKRCGMYNVISRADFWRIPPKLGLTKSHTHDALEFTWAPYLESWEAKYGSCMDPDVWKKASPSLAQHMQRQADWEQGIVDRLRVINTPIPDTTWWEKFRALWCRK